MKWEPDDIVIHNWPKLQQTPNGKWTRCWNIVLKDEIKNHISLTELEATLSDGEKLVKIEKNGKELRVWVTTDRWGWDDDLYFYSYLMLKRINDLLGRIERIQDQSRDLWEPWLSRDSESKENDAKNS
jgi:hypothetical protein